MTMLYHIGVMFFSLFFFSSRRRHTRSYGDWSSDVCSSDLRVTDEHGTYARFLVEIGLKRKDAEHQIDRPRHSFDAARIPSPHLRTDVINYFLLWRLQRTGQTQIESRIVDQYDCVWFALLNFFERFAKLFPKITILPEHFPQTENSRVANPVFELLAGALLHLRTAAPDELQLAIQLAQAMHQCGAVIVSAHLAGDEVDGFHGERTPCRQQNRSKFTLLRTRRDLLRDFDCQLQSRRRLRTRNARLASRVCAFNKRS